MASATRAVTLRAIRAPECFAIRAERGEGRSNDQTTSQNQRCFHKVPRLTLKAASVRSSFAILLLVRRPFRRKKCGVALNGCFRWDGLRRAGPGRFRSRSETAPALERHRRNRHQCKLANHE